MTDKRDRRTAKTPPHGVAKQLAPAEFPARAPTGDEWSGDTGVNERDEDTPVGLETLDAQAAERMRHRVKETNQTTLAIKETVDTTHIGIDTLRLEHRNDIRRMETVIGFVESKVTDVKADVDELKASHREMRVELKANTKATERVADQFPRLIDALASDRTLTRETDHVRTREELKVGAHEATVKIDEGAKKRQWWRDAKLKAIGAVLGLLTSGAVGGYILTSLRC